MPVKFDNGKTIIVRQLFCPICQEQLRIKKASLKMYDCGDVVESVKVLDLECESCGELLKPKSGDCCVYCSYGSMKCSPIQLNNGSCCC